MIIREKGYEHWDGTLRESRFPWWPITRLGIRLAFKKKNFKFVFFSALLPSFVFLTGIFISERLEDFRFMVRGSPQLLQITPGYFRTYFAGEFLLFMLVMIMVFAGAGLIADDLRYNSLQAYFARPVRKLDYILGKAGTVSFFLLTLTLVPGIVFIIAKLVFSGSFAFLYSYPWLPLSIIVCSAFFTLFFCAYTLLLSALSRNRRYVSILIFAIYIFSDILFGILYGNSGNPYFSLLSLKSNLQQMAAFFFRLKPPQPVPWILSLLVLASIILVSVVVLKKKVKGVEVVK